MFGNTHSSRRSQLYVELIHSPILQCSFTDCEYCLHGVFIFAFEFEMLNAVVV